MRRSLLSALALTFALAVPSVALAQITPTFTAFGSHGPNANLITQPIGATECASDSISLTFSPSMSTNNRLIDVWWASSNSAGCQTGTTRASTSSPVCNYLTSMTYVPVSSSATLSFPISTLFSGCTSTTRWFYFFDVAASHENTMNYTTYWLLNAQLSSSAPTAPTISSTPAGDTQLAVTWNASTFTSLGTTGQVYLFADTSGCGGDGGTSTLVGGGTAPSTHLAAQSATSPFNIDTSVLGWNGTNYGATAAIAIAVVDSASNVSPLSNVVCAQHVQVTGFWERYCAEHGMPDIAQCTAYYHGCSVGVPARRWDLGALTMLAVTFGLFVARRRLR